ncbi:hypothetical protein [Polaribacter sp. IC073]|uniref:hypothetical protein n=1 Tax=Polaribacter sp. IC073 TaxID=2508540 RepID=UPI0011BE1638|nr:hypothetical protein [Polaribacter sp. IC073]TXD48669.1 hypothetical protein ES045_05435 [Polaribacter sp. IC073]
MFLVFIVIGIAVVWFVLGKKEEVAKVNVQGGLDLKYKELIDHFLIIPNIEIEKKNSYSMTLVVKGVNVQTRFTIGHGFEDVSVFWNHQSIMFGKHSLNWNFPEYLPQSQMIDKIEKELEIYQRNLIGNGF